ncbi:DEAD/DEAH box helicase [Chloroflexi bacterium TSY]|nr:DEAD/DEAH box helicase [Chloroflexi bacterium TSY]
MSLPQILTDLRADPGFMENVAAWHTQPARVAQSTPHPEALHPLLRAALAQRGFGQLYSHQSEACQFALKGNNLIIVTPTASGKTLCYNSPVLHSLLNDAAARALYLFPTKALAQDQLTELQIWKTELASVAESFEESAGVNGSNRKITDRQELPLPEVETLYIFTYDGDTPRAHRSSIRRQARLLLTNPDMLHAGILPYHTNWAEFFGGLRYVVIDEMHIYRGVFGSHVANVLRRLQRICRFYGSRPQFICTSATIANPAELAECLLEQPVHLINQSGAPSGEKHIILYNPPCYDPDRGLRRAATLEAQEIAARTVLGGVQTIVFGRSRLTTEVLLTYLRERLACVPDHSGLATSDHPPSTNTQPHRLDLTQSVRGYRGGYLPTERREIEAGLRSGEVRAVVATNALELGIDIGQLQAAILCGYPGNIASTWQQMGRAGRTQETAVAILITTSGLLDQYVIQHPEFIFERSPEQAIVNPDNLMLLVDQLRCAAFELPFQVGEAFGNCTFTFDVLALLTEQGDIQQHGTWFHWSGEGYPARQVSLRNAGGQTVVIQVDSDQQENGQPEIIGEVDLPSAQLLVHQGAIYIHEGRSYQVNQLDLDNQLAIVSPANVNYYTDVGAETEITILAEHEWVIKGGAQVAYGDLLVSSQVVSFRRVRHQTHENLGVTPLDYPPQLIETSGYWFSVSEQTQQTLMERGQWMDAPNDYAPNWQEQRVRVRSRDQYRCAVCGLPEPADRQHDVHHTIPFRTFGYVPGINENYREANRLDNLQLLCRRCHRRVEATVRTRGALDGLAYALHHLAPLHLMCDRSDIGVSVERETIKAKAEAKEVGTIDAEGLDEPSSSALASASITSSPTNI